MEASRPTEALPPRFGPVPQGLGLVTAQGEDRRSPGLEPLRDRGWPRGVGAGGRALFQEQGPWAEVHTDEPPLFHERCLHCANALAHFLRRLPRRLPGQRRLQAGSRPRLPHPASGGGGTPPRRRQRPPHETLAEGVKPSPALEPERIKRRPNHTGPPLPALCRFPPPRLRGAARRGIAWGRRGTLLFDTPVCRAPRRTLCVPWAQRSLKIRRLLAHTPMSVGALKDGGPLGGMQCLRVSDRHPLVPLYADTPRIRPAKCSCDAVHLTRHSYHQW